MPTASAPFVSDLRTLRDRFRDEAQREEVGELIRSRLADNRLQDECRYLLRFCWQLRMTYTEVTWDELGATVSPEKLAVVVDLLRATRDGHAAIDSWIMACRALPEVIDRPFLRGAT